MRIRKPNFYVALLLFFGTSLSLYAADAERGSAVTVYYATLRQSSEVTVPVTQFGWDFSKDKALTFGVATVVPEEPILIPEDISGRLTKVAATAEDAIKKTAFMTPSQFTDTMRKKPLLLYIHGFNNTFSTAIFQAALLKLKVKFAGNIVVFSWPSHGLSNGYRSDEVSAKLSHPALQGLLRSIVPSDLPRHILAHSMGSVVLVDAIATTQIPPKSFANIMLAAPDIKQLRFREEGPLLVATAKRTTFYYSSEDAALAASELVHGHSRAGLYPQFIRGMDTIKADEVNSSMLAFGHSYFSSADKVLNDIAAMINDDKPVKDRSEWLHKEPTERDWESHWGFKPIYDGH